MMARIMERGKSSGRIDDNAEAIRKRLVIYHESTMPIIREFEARGKLREINSDQTIGTITIIETTLAYANFWLFSRGATGEAARLQPP